MLKAFGDKFTDAEVNDAESFHVDLTRVLLEGTEGLCYNLIFISLTRGLVGEHLEEGGEVDWAWGFSKHGIEISLRDKTSNLIVSATDILFAQDTIVVTVHDSETILELSYLSLGEHVEDIAA